MLNLMCNTGSPFSSNLSESFRRARDVVAQHKGAEQRRSQQQQQHKSSSGVSRRFEYSSDSYRGMCNKIIKHNKK